MNYIPISIISEIDDDRQIWTFDIEESDLVAIMDKYGAHGSSLRGDIIDILTEAASIWKNEHK